MTDISQGGEENNKLENDFFNMGPQYFTVNTMGAQRAQYKIPFSESDNFVEVIAHLGVFAKNISIVMYSNYTIIVGDDPGFDVEDYNSWVEKCKSGKRGISEHGHGARTSIEKYLKNDNYNCNKIKIVTRNKNIVDGNYFTIECILEPDPKKNFGDYIAPKRDLRPANEDEKEIFIRYLNNGYGTCFIFDDEILKNIKIYNEIKKRCMLFLSMRIYNKDLNLKFYDYINKKSENIVIKYPLCSEKEYKTSIKLQINICPYHKKNVDKGLKQLIEFRYLNDKNIYPEFDNKIYRLESKIKHFKDLEELNYDEINKKNSLVTYTIELINIANEENKEDIFKYFKDKFDFDSTYNCGVYIKKGNLILNDSGFGGETRRAYAEPEFKPIFLLEHTPNHTNSNANKSNWTNNQMSTYMRHSLKFIKFLFKIITTRREKKKLPTPAPDADITKEPYNTTPTRSRNNFTPQQKLKEYKQYQEYSTDVLDRSDGVNRCTTCDKFFKGDTTEINGHIISDHNDGDTSDKNLLIICQHCNGNDTRNIPQMMEEDWGIKHPNTLRVKNYLINKKKYLCHWS
jgi:hypothetical protein